MTVRAQKVTFLNFGKNGLFATVFICHSVYFLCFILFVAVVILERRRMKIPSAIITATFHL